MREIKVTHIQWFRFFYANGYWSEGPGGEQYTGTIDIHALPVGMH
jgi:hypothetical protein